MGDKRSKRPLGIVVWGATGYTGNIICEYLTKNAPESVKWAIGGRNKSKLENLKHALTKVSEKAKNIDILVGDVEEQASVDAITKQTRVILNCAGPFSLHGTPIVASCVRNATDYCDITGEYTWVRQLIDDYDADAKRNGALIVNCCGMDSIPSDLGTFFVTSHVKKTYGVNCESVKAYVTRIAGGVSGGTIGSAMAIIEKPTKGMRDPNFLIPNNTSKVKQPDDLLMMVERDDDMKLWRYPHPLAVTDNRVVRRSQHVMGYPNGDFSYRLVAGSPSFIKALIVTFFVATMVICMQFKFIRYIIAKLMPPGSGPKKENLRRGGCEIVTLAKLEKSKAGVPKFVKGRVSFRGDPGYLVTSAMVAESALCLATQRDILPAQQGGIHTPSSSMGMLLIERLKNAGIQFEIDGPYEP